MASKRVSIVNLLYVDHYMKAPQKSPPIEMNPKELLINLGFVESASAEILHNGWEFSITRNKNAANILYAFIFFTNEEDERVVYVGHSRKQFDRRLYGYQNGGGQAVNNRIHRAVSSQLRQGGGVKVMCLPNSFQFSMQSIPVDLAAGLEYGLISHIAEFNKANGLPALYNIAGNRHWLEADNPPHLGEDEAVQAERQEEDPAVPENQIQEEQLAILQREPRDQFSIPLSEKTYWPLALFNPPARVAEWFGPHDDIVLILLKENNGTHTLVRAVVNRTANRNQCPRLFMRGDDGIAYQAWKCQNHIIGDNVNAQIMGVNQLVLQ